MLSLLAAYGDRSSTLMRSSSLSDTCDRPSDSQPVMLARQSHLLGAMYFSLQDTQVRNTLVLTVLALMLDMPPAQPARLSAPRAVSA